MTQVARYQIPEGLLFKTEKEGQGYISNKIQEELYEKFKRIDFYDLKHRDMVKIFEFFIGDYKTIVELQHYLNDIVGFNPYIPEEVEE